VASIIGFTRKSEIITGINTKEEIIERAINNNYHSIIDVGSYFINDNTDKIAKNILEKLKDKNSEINCVIYINKEHKKLGLMSDFRIIPYDSINIPLKNRFYFFDQSHITGIDMKIYSEAKGLITLSSFNRYRDAAQGIFRLRNINNGHKIHFFFNNIYKTKKINLEYIYEKLIFNSETKKLLSKSKIQTQCIKYLNRSINKKSNFYKEPIFYDMFQNFFQENQLNQTLLLHL
jgi:hypothetical protein